MAALAEKAPAVAGAQTEGRCGAGPVRGLLGGKPSPAARRRRRHLLRPLPLTPSGMAEAAVELLLVPAVHDAVAVVVEVPQVTRFAGPRPERRPEQVTVARVHDPVAVGVAEQAEQGIDAVTAGHARAGAVQGLPEAVVDEAAVDGQRVLPGGRRPA